MEIKLPVSELKAALPALARIVSRSPSLPVLHMLRISRSHDGIVQLQATDLESFVSYRFEGQVGEPLEMLVAFKSLSRAVKGCNPTDQITLARDNDTTVLRSLLAGRPVERSLESMDPQQWPETPAFQDAGIVLDDGIKEGILRALSCCTHEITRAAIMGAWLDVTDPEAHYVMGTDGRHLYSANSFHIDLQEPILIPHEGFLESPAFRNDGPWSIAVQAGDTVDERRWLQMRSKRWTFLTRRPDHTIPNWRQVVPTSRTVTVTFSEKATAFLLEILPKLPGKDDPSQPIRLDVTGGRFLVTAGDRNTPHQTTLPVDDTHVEGPDVAIVVDRSFVSKALQWGMTELALIDELSPLVFSAPGRRLVAMPMRLDGPLSPAPEVPESAPIPSDTHPEPSPIEPEETPMPKNAAPEVEPAPEPQPVNRLTPFTEEAPKDKPTIRSVIEQIDGIRDALRATARQFGDVVDALRVVEKDRKTTDKEVELVREKLRALQAVSF